LRSNKSSKFDGELKESEHFCYFCVKNNGADKLAELNWGWVKEEILKEQSEENLYALGDEDGRQAS
jgi:hypothetical protein